MRNRINAERADAVALCLPAPQVLPLASAYPSALDALTGVAMAPCWTLMIAFDTESPAPDVPATVTPESGPISWLAAEATKPGRAGTPPRLTLHACADWSAANLEMSREQATNALLHALGDLSTGPLPAVAQSAAHRWRYARTRVPLGAPFLEIEAGSLYAAGDWCLGARVECGFDSGMAVAEAILNERMPLTRI